MLNLVEYNCTGKLTDTDISIDKLINKCSGKQKASDITLTEQICDMINVIHNKDDIE